MEKEDVIHTHKWNIIQPSKKKEILPFTTRWIELEGIILSEINQRKTIFTQFHSYVEFRKQNTGAEEKGGKNTKKSERRRQTIRDS